MLYFLNEIKHKNHTGSLLLYGKIISKTIYLSNAFLRLKNCFFLTISYVHQKINKYALFEK